jgi:hypothetical protein
LASVLKSAVLAKATTLVSPSSAVSKLPEPIAAEGPVGD